MANIAEISLLLTNNAERFMAGMEAAAGTIDNFDRRLQTITTSNVVLNQGLAATSAVAQRSSSALMSIVSTLSKLYGYYNLGKLIYQGFKDWDKLKDAFKPLAESLVDVKNKGLSITAAIKVMSSSGGAAVDVLRTKFGQMVATKIAFKVAIYGVTTAFKGLFGVLRGGVSVVNSLATATANATRSMLSLGGAIHPAVGALAGFGAIGGGIYGLKRIVDSAIESNTALRALQASSGISVASLSALQGAASAAGVSINALTGGATSLDRAIGSALADPAGESADALKRFGLSAHDLANLSPEQKLQAMADAMSRFAPSAERTAAAEALLGSNAQALLPLLSKGGDYLAENARQAERLGASLTAVQSENLTKAGEAMNKLGTAFGAFGTQIAVNVAPYITHASEAMIRFIEESDAARTIGESLGHAVAGAGWLAAKAWDTVKLAIVSSKLVLLEMAIAANEFSSNFQIGAAYLSGESWEQLEKRAQAGAKATIALTETQRQFAEEMKKIHDAPTTMPWVDGLKGIKNAANEAAEATERAAEKLKEFQKAQTQQEKDRAAYFADLESRKGLAGLSEEKRADAEIESKVRGLGGDDDIVGFAQSQERHLRNLERIAKLNEEGRSNAEKYADAMKKLNELQKTSVNGNTLLSPEAFAKEADRLRKELLGGDKKGEYQRPELAERGSKEAIKAIDDYRNRDKREELAKRTAVAAEKSAKATADQTAELRGIRDELRCGSRIEIGVLSGT